MFSGIDAVGKLLRATAQMGAAQAVLNPLGNLLLVFRLYEHGNGHKRVSLTKSADRYISSKVEDMPGKPISFSSVTRMLKSAFPVSITYTAFSLAFAKVWLRVSNVLMSIAYDAMTKAPFLPSSLKAVL